MMGSMRTPVELVGAFRASGPEAIQDVYVDTIHQLAIDGAPDFRSDALAIVFHGTCAPCAGT